MIRLLTFSFLFWLSAVCKAQQEKIMAKSTGMYRWSAGIAVGIAPLPDNLATINPTGEFYIKPGLSILAEIALQTGKNKNFDSTAVNKKYFRFKTELRYYVQKPGRWVTPYFGLRLTTAKRQFDVERQGRYYDRGGGDSAWFYDRASVSSPFFTGSLQMGLVKEIAGNVYFECSMGYGLKFSNTAYPLAANLRKEKESGWFNIKPVSAYRYIGRRTASHFTIGFRFFYRF